jgi:hypothetical protein
MIITIIIIPQKGGSVGGKNAGGSDGHDIRGGHGHQQINGAKGASSDDRSPGGPLTWLVTTPIIPHPPKWYGSHVSPLKPCCFFFSPPLPPFGDFPAM